LVLSGLKVISFSGKITEREEKAKGKERRAKSKEQKRGARIQRCLGEIAQPFYPKETGFLPKILFRFSLQFSGLPENKKGEMNSQLSFFSGSGFSATIIYCYFLSFIPELKNIN